MTRTNRGGLATIVVGVLVVMSLTSCTFIAREGQNMRDEQRAALHIQVQEAVGLAVPEAADVGVTTGMDGFATVLSVDLELPDPADASVDLVDRAFGAAFAVDGGQTTFIQLSLRSGDSPIPMADIIAEMGVQMSPTALDISLDDQELAERYGN